MGDSKRPTIDCSFTDNPLVAAQIEEEQWGMAEQEKNADDTVPVQNGNFPVAGHSEVTY